MQLEPIISALRVRCPVFSGRIAGAAEFKHLPESAALPVPCAFVIPLDENPGESRSQNSVRQDLVESFAVIVAVSNVVDEKGQGAISVLHPTRAALWAALLGWQPTTDYTGIVYEGGSLLDIDRARLWYQFEFSAAMEIGPEDGWQQTDLENLPHFDGVNIKVDVIDPIADPNVQSPGPDGRIEFEFSAPAAGNLP